MLADTAVAVSPDDDRYRDVVGKHAILPLAERRLPVIADEHVDPEFGTGALKITPGHDPNDFEIGRNHDLPAISVIGEDGLITDEAPERFRGMTAAEAQAAVVAELRDRGLIRGRGAVYAHRAVLPPLRRADRAADLAAVVLPDGRDGPPRRRRRHARGRSGSFPTALGASTWTDGEDPALVHLPPALVGAPTARLVPGRRDPRRGDAARGRRMGAGGGRPRHLVQLGALAVRHPRLAGHRRPRVQGFLPDRRAGDGAGHHRPLGRADDHDLARVHGQVPFTDVYVHSIIQAPDGRRMSKSLGTGIDPLEEIDQHGADALRFGLLAMTSTQDVRFSEARVQQGRDLANKMWNASRLVLMEGRDAVEPGPRPNRVEDRWIASRLQRAVRLRRRSRSRPTTSRMRHSTSTSSSGPSSATGTWRSSSRACTTAKRTRPPLCSGRSSRCSRSLIR